MRKADGPEQLSGVKTISDVHHRDKPFPSRSPLPDSDGPWNTNTDKALGPAASSQEADGEGAPRISHTFCLWTN